MTRITSTTRRIVAIALTAIAIAVLMTIVFVGLHTTVASNRQSLHHAQDEVHLATMGGQRPKADLARMGLWGGRNADLASATFRVPIWGGRIA